MEENSKKLKTHFRISLILFIILLFTRFLFAEIPLNYGRGDATLGSLLFLFFGTYLTFILPLYFKNIFDTWKNNGFWQRYITKFYSLLFLFSVFVVLLFSTEKKQTFTELFFSPEIPGINPISLFFQNIVFTFLVVGLSLVFPISVYATISSIKSLIIAKRENKSYSFGIIF